MLPLLGFNSFRLVPLTLPGNRLRYASTSTWTWLRLQRLRRKRKRSQNATPCSCLVRPCPPPHPIRVMHPFLLLFFWCNNKISESFFFFSCCPTKIKGCNNVLAPSVHPLLRPGQRLLLLQTAAAAAAKHTGNHLLYLIFLRFFCGFS